MLQKEGLIKCCILPPRTLYHPVLPFRCNNKLLFCLCKACAIEQNSDVCTHETIADRALLSSWVVDEIRLAVEKGYRLIEVFEVYEYEVTQYDPASGRSGLFVEYINTFLSLRQRLAGTPPGFEPLKMRTAILTRSKRGKASYWIGTRFVPTLLNVRRLNYV